MEFLLYILIGLNITYYSIHSLNKNHITGDVLISWLNDRELQDVFYNHPLWFKKTLCFIFLLETLFWPLVLLYLGYKYITSDNNNNNYRFNGFSI